MTKDSRRCHPRGAQPTPRSESQTGKYWDLSPKVTESLPVWPGDTAYERTENSRITDGDTVDLSWIKTTLHLGSHADAPRHTEAPNAGKPLGIDQMPLDAYFGPAVVVEADLRDDHNRIAPEVADRVDLRNEQRVLLRTGVDQIQNKANPEQAQFPTDFAGLSPKLARRLVDAGVRLVGTDAPSIDPFPSQELEVHHLLLGNGIAVLEGLLLAHVPLGHYELIALPLHLADADASPVRAILRAL